MKKARDERKAILQNNKHIKNAAKPKNQQQLMLFLSFDITDSTKLKVIYPEKWPKIIDILVNTKFQLMNYWKFNGDEILYKRNINSLEFVCRIIDKANEHLKKLNTAMAKEIQDISVKGTIWIALSETDASHYMHNFSFKFEDEIDFVGKNIDEGFRLTKCSSMSKIAVDPKIVYIILDTYAFLRKDALQNKKNPFYRSKDSCDTTTLDKLDKTINDTLKNLHLVGYTHCKGVWNDNPYPVYWYYDGTVKSSIRYNEFLCGEHLWQKSITSIGDPNIVDSEYRNLNEIFKHMNILKEIDSIYKLLIMEGDVELSAASKANLYYMVVCVNPKTNKVMIAKRSIKRKHLKNVWDFGNVKYQNINMKDTIEKEYKNTFGIDIELVVDKDRGNNLKPFGYCTIYRNCKPQNSILCHAEIINPNNLDDAELIQYIMEHKSAAYDEIRFVSVDDVENFNCLTLDEIRIDSEKAEFSANKPFAENTCIMYFKDSIKGVINERK